MAVKNVQIGIKLRKLRAYVADVSPIP